jgi:hypothetical protein
MFFLNQREGDTGGDHENVGAPFGVPPMRPGSDSLN